MDYRWTPEKSSWAMSLWIEGRSASEIAALMGGDVTRNAVIGRIHRMGGAGRTRRTGAQRTALPKRSKPAPRTTVSPPPIRQMDFAPLEPLPPIDDTPATVSFSDLERHHCRAITTAHMPFDADAKVYCGQRQMPGMSFCEPHCRRYFAAPMPAKQNNWTPSRTTSAAPVYGKGRERIIA